MRGLRWVGACLLIAGLLGACGAPSSPAAPPTAVPNPPTTAPTVPAAAKPATSPVGVASPSPAAAALAPGTPAPKPLPSRTDVVISMVAQVENYAGALMAKALGEYEEENLNATIQTMPATDAYLLMSQGKVQMHVGGLSGGLLNLISQRDSMRQVGYQFDVPPGTKEGWWFRKEYFNADGTPNAGKLKGAPVMFGFNGKGETTVVTLEPWLKKSDMTLADLAQGPALSSADGLVAVKNASVAGVYLLTPVWLLADQDPNLQHIPNTSFSLATYIMSTDFTKNQPDVAKAILRATMRTQRTYLQGDYHADPKVLAALAEATQTPPDRLQATPPFIFSRDLKIPDSAKQYMQAAQTSWIQTGGILQFNEQIAMDRLIDTTLAEQVAAER